MNRATLHKMTAGCFLAALVVVACSEQVGFEPGGANGKNGKNTDDVTNGGGGGGKGEPTATGLPCDVDQVLKTRCQTCHAAEPKYGASTALTSYDDLQKSAPGGGKKLYELVKERVANDARPMPPSPNPRLTAEEVKALDTWIAGGAKSVPDRCTNDGPKDDVKPLSCKPDVVLKAAKPFVMKPTDPQDQYVCFGVERNLDKKRHVVGLAPKVDNKKILHHILLFQAPNAESSDPFPCEAFGSAAWKLVAGWAPGGNNLELPPEAGFPEEKGTTHWVLQLHYNNALNKNGESDQSGYELCTTDQLRPNDAGVLAFGSTKFTIPPRASHTIRCDYTLPQSFANVKMFNASPHMHTRGSAMSTERLPGGANGTPEKVFDQKAFDFEAQANYPISAAVNPGDVMRTRCSWKNPGDTQITFGEATNEEMCFDFIGYYPNIPDRTVFGLPIFTWVTPSSSARCTAE